MFQWLTRLVWHDDVLGEIIPGLTRREEQYHEEKKRRHEKEVQARLEHERYKRDRELSDPFWARRESERKRELLELKLEDAKWILEHEKRLVALQKKKLRGNDHRRNNLEPIPSACGNWNTTSQDFAAPSTKRPGI